MNANNLEGEEERSAKEAESIEPSSGGAEALAPATPTAEFAREESRLGRFLRQLVRWTLGVLILIGVGFVAALLLFYIPMRREAATRATELSAAQTRIEELEGELAAKAQMEKLYQEALERLKRADFQNNLLRLQLEVASARIYLYQDQKELAGTAMRNAQSIFKALQTGATPAQRTALSEMEARLDLALSGLEKDLYAAQSDLDVLARRLSDFSASLTASSP
ncbi:MAG: hypothetical protein NZ840_12165 [Anaerolineales bacterium]|nr:hypothetical protein [Anaerolineales bacterium]MDW8162790.1 hypothetical protein [Anaerolineales bacterium]